jgi:Beta-ketoacyl synthase, C-terminal domain
VKPNVGHSEGASGITSLIKTVLALEHRIIPPNINFCEPNPKSMALSRNSHHVSIINTLHSSIRGSTASSATGSHTVASRSRKSQREFFWNRRCKCPRESSTSILRLLLSIQGRRGFCCFVWHKIFCQRSKLLNTESSSFTRVFCKSSRFFESEHRRVSATGNITSTSFERFGP